MHEEIDKILDEISNVQDKFRYEIREVNQSVDKKHYLENKIYFI